MKYFTHEHYLRGNSADPQTMQGIEDAWERALRSYRRRWARIRHAFPKSVQRFMAENICLHDAQLLSMTRSGKQLGMVLQLEPPAGDVVILTFQLAGELEIDTAALSKPGDSRSVAWLYEEWDVDRGGQCWFEVLLSNGWSLRLPFRDFRYSIGEQLLPCGNGTRARGRNAVSSMR